uniref:Uncharacterized protein n=1 Tax=Rhizophora mucronata TaxID=61149 RepID=A0A2P2MYA9_RHIMU
MTCLCRMSGVLSKVKCLSSTTQPLKAATMNASMKRARGIAAVSV